MRLKTYGVGCWENLETVENAIWVRIWVLEWEGEWAKIFIVALEDDEKW
jgi:hypothetical protein